nr:hypothetical protein [Tanacetum cinerariifolium]
NEETNNGTANLNSSQDRRITHGLPISSQDTMADNSSTQVKTKGPNNTLAKGESMEEQEAMEIKAPKNLRTETDIWKLYTDGASNEQGSKAGLILIDLEGA